MKHAYDLSCHPKDEKWVSISILRLVALSTRLKKTPHVRVKTFLVSSCVLDVVFSLQYAGEWKNGYFARSAHALSSQLDLDSIHYYFGPLIKNVLLY